MKKIIGLILCLALVFALAVPVFAANESETDKDAEAVIMGWYDAVNRQAWDEMLAYEHSITRKDDENFLNSSQMQEEQRGLYNVKSIKILKLYPVDRTVNPFYADTFGYELRFNTTDLKAYVAAVDMTVKKEDDFTRNGLVYHLVVLARENGKWTFAGSGGTDTFMMEAAIPEEDRTLDTLKAMEIWNVRYHFNFAINMEGKILDINSVNMKPYDNFKSNKGQTYVPSSFTDVDESAWYGAEAQAVIARACEYGLVAGKGGGVFDPNGSLTLAEAIKLACVINSIYNGGTGKLEQGSPWYQVYVDYAVEKGIIEKADFAGDYDRTATRAETAYIFSRAVPDKGLPQINDIKAPDVNADTAYSANILKLYNAGILRGGSDGKFFPESNITRAEAAALAVRLAVPTERTYVFRCVG